jgi:hypothetical protein
LKEFDLKKFNTVLNRYKFPFRVDSDVIQFGGVDDIKFLSRYYIYYPVVIGLALTGFVVVFDFFILLVLGTPFLVYAVYGVIHVQIKKKNNRNTIIFRSNEVHISIDSLDVRIESTQIRSYEFEIEQIGKNHYEGILKLVSKEEREYDILFINDTKKSVLKNDLKFLAEFLQNKQRLTQKI